MTTHPVTYTDPEQVTDVRALTQPKRNATGYGPKIPTQHEIRYAGRWRRVYVMQYGNAGSAYIIVKHCDVFLDSDTESRLESR